MVRRIDTQIIIDAPPQRVWAVLIDFARYPEWNPFIRRIQGEPKAGGTLSVEMKPPDGRAVSFFADVIKAEPNSELRWIGNLWAPFLFAGQHAFEIQPIGPAQ